jgi:hypothetical protein
MQFKNLRDVFAAYAGNLKDLTVLAHANDPFRVDNERGHREGGWLATTLAALDITGQKHLRGLHYVLVSAQVSKPDGLRYTNTDDDWDWLGKAAKAARWLGYVPFDRIVDQRNDEPVIRPYATRANPTPYVTVDVEVSIPDAQDLQPYVGLSGFTTAQPYRLVMVGEKSSLSPVLDPIAIQYGADLYLPTGEISDTLIYRMARDEARDGRPMVVFYFSDCDPAGWQMPISVARKLQALKVVEFPELEFETHRVSLTPEQVIDLGLPISPLKSTEQRADKWTSAMGVQQTEIDALAELQPAVLRDQADAAMSPFFDATLDARRRRLMAQWQTAAQQAIAEQGGDEMERLRADAADRLEEIREQIAAIVAEIELDADMFDLPEIPAPPTPELTGEPPEPLVDSRWDFADQCRRLIDSKEYRTN